jgi:SAM-dependent methyltransferase
MSAAGRGPETILNVARGFMQSRILLTAIELDLFARLTKKPSTADQVAKVLKSDPRATTMLLDALSAMGLLLKKKQVYAVSCSVAGLLDRSRESVLPMARHALSLWRSWDRLTEVVRTGKPPVTQRDLRNTEDLEAFIHAMRVVSTPVADAIARAIEPGEARRLLDIGAGPATYTTALVRQNSNLKATVFDLPPVIEIAREEVRKVGLLRRFTFVAGDFYEDPLPGGHDLALLSAIIHQNSEEENRELYRKVFDALEPGGRVVIRDHVMDPTRTVPAAGALFAINMLVATKGGSTYTLAEIRSDLESAGFTNVHQTRSGEMMDSLVTAVKPS